MKLSNSLYLAVASSVAIASAVDPFTAISAVEAPESIFNRAATSSNQYSRCGNGRIDHGELCDPKYGYGGDPYCNPKTCKCKNGYSSRGGRCQAERKCGNGKIDASAGEQCDPHFGRGDPNCDSRTCKCKAGYTPKRGGLCQKKATSYCGDGKISGQEECDPLIAGGDPHCNRATCKCEDKYEPDPVLPSDGGTSLCRSKCQNGQRDEGEECDPSVFGGDSNCSEDCKCNPGFEPDPAGYRCMNKCGNGKIDSDIGEQCDKREYPCSQCQCVEGSVPDGDKGCTYCGTILEQCDSGLFCQADCSCEYPYSPKGDGTCTTCGDGTYDPQYETCDGGANCVDCACIYPYFFPDGRGGCNSCGNRDVDGSDEECDGGDLCNSDCTCPDKTRPIAGGNGCEYYCGNGQIDPGEECDGGGGCTDQCKNT